MKHGTNRAYGYAGLASGRLGGLAQATIYKDDGATLADLREAVTTLEEIDPIARRVLGGAHPLTEWIEYDLQQARATLAARETPSGSA